MKRLLLLIVVLVMALVSGSNGSTDTALTVKGNSGGR